MIGESKQSKENGQQFAAMVWEFIRRDPEYLWAWETVVQRLRNSAKQAYAPLYEIHENALGFPTTIAQKNIEGLPIEAYEEWSAATYFGMMYFLEPWKSFEIMATDGIYLYSLSVNWHMMRCDVAFLWRGGTAFERSLNAGSQHLEFELETSNNVCLEIDLNRVKNVTKLIEYIKGELDLLLTVRSIVEAESYSEARAIVIKKYGPESVRQVKELYPEAIQHGEHDAYNIDKLPFLVRKELEYKRDHEQPPANAATAFKKRFDYKRTLAAGDAYFEMVDYAYQPRPDLTYEQVARKLFPKEFSQNSAGAKTAAVRST